MCVAAVRTGRKGFSSLEGGCSQGLQHSTCSHALLPSLRGIGAEEISLKGIWADISSDSKVGTGGWGSVCVLGVLGSPKLAV